MVALLIYFQIISRIAHGAFRLLIEVAPHPLHTQWQHGKAKMPGVVCIWVKDEHKEHPRNTFKAQGPASSRLLTGGLVSREPEMMSPMFRPPAGTTRMTSPFRQKRLLIVPFKEIDSSIRWDYDILRLSNPY